MKWALSIALTILMATYPAYSDELAEADLRIEEPELVGAGSGDLGIDALELTQVKKAETDAQGCRRNHADQSANQADNSRLVALLERRRCSLFDEVAREKRRAYELRKRIAKQQGR